MISDQQIASYAKDGFIVVKHLIPELLLESIKTVVSRIMDSAAGITEHDEIFDLENSHTADQPRVRRIKSPSSMAAG